MLVLGFNTENNISAFYIEKPNKCIPSLTFLFYPEPKKNIGLLNWNMDWFFGLDDKKWIKAVCELFCFSTDPKMYYNQ